MMFVLPQAPRSHASEALACIHKLQMTVTTSSMRTHHYGIVLQGTAIGPILTRISLVDR